MIVLRILLGAAFTTLFCLAAGDLLLHSLRLTLDRAGRRFAPFLLGAVLVSTFVFGLCSLRQFNTALLVISGTCTLAAWVRICRPRFRPTLDLDLPPIWQALFWLPWTLFGATYLLAAMAPEISPDGAVYHLGLVYRYYEHRGFYTIPTTMFAGLFAGLEMLFLAAFSIGKHSAAALVHLVFLLVSPFGILAIAKRLDEPKAGVLAAMLFYLSPVVAKDGTTAYVDTGTAAVLIAAFYFLQLWKDSRTTRALIPAALLTGFAVACKITAGSFVVFALFAVLTVALPWKARLRQTCAFLVFAALPVLPWLIKNTIQFRNPVFPLLNRLFPNPFLYQILEDEMRRIVAHLSDVTWAQIPWEATTGGKLAGILGPIFLALPIGLLAIRRRSARTVLLAAACILITYPSNIGARFLIPALPFLALAMSIAVTRLPVVGTALATAVLLAHGMLSWPPWIERWSGHFQWRIDTLEWRSALRLTPEREFFRIHWPDYERGLLLDRFVAPGELIYSPQMGQMAYHRREILGTSDSALGRRVFLTYLMPLAPELGGTFTRDMHFSATTTRALRLTVARTFDTDLRISEVRFYSGDHEIPRKPGWRITSSDNPWEAPLAFDNSAISFWTSGSRMREGMWLQVDFGEPATVDRIVIEQNLDQRWMSLQPAFPGADGWTIHRSHYTPRLTPRRADSRMEAHDEFWRLGIRWILIPDSYYGAVDIRDHAAEWGVVQAAMANDFRLWKLLPPQ